MAYRFDEDYHEDSQEALKVVVCGEMNVGKTCLCTKGCNGFFPSNASATVCAAHFSKHERVSTQPPRFLPPDTAIYFQIQERTRIQQQEQQSLSSSTSSSTSAGLLTPPSNLDLLFGPGNQTLSGVSSITAGTASHRSSGINSHHHHYRKSVIGSSRSGTSGKKFRRVPSDRDFSTRSSSVTDTESDLDRDLERRDESDFSPRDDSYNEDSNYYGAGEDNDIGEEEAEERAIRQHLRDEELKMRDMESRRDNNNEETFEFFHQTTASNNLNNNLTPNNDNNVNGANYNKRKRLLSGNNAKSVTAGRSNGKEENINKITDRTRDTNNDGRNNNPLTTTGTNTFAKTTTLGTTKTTRRSLHTVDTTTITRKGLDNDIVEKTPHNSHLPPKSAAEAVVEEEGSSGTLRHVQMQIWDTAGQERYRSITSVYYRDIHACIVVFDITSPSSFNRAKMWLSEALKNSGAREGSNAQRYLVLTLCANKMDQVNDCLREYQDYIRNKRDTSDNSTKNGGGGDDDNQSNLDISSGNENDDDREENDEISQSETEEKIYENRNTRIRSDPNNQKTTAGKNRRSTQQPGGGHHRMRYGDDESSADESMTSSQGGDFDESMTDDDYRHNVNNTSQSTLGTHNTSMASEGKYDFAAVERQQRRSIAIRTLQLLEEAQQYAQSQGAIFFRTSALTGENVENLFYCIARESLLRSMQRQADEARRNREENELRRRFNINNPHMDIDNGRIINLRRDRLDGAARDGENQRAGNQGTCCS